LRRGGIGFEQAPQLRNKVSAYLTVMLSIFGKQRYDNSDMVLFRPGEPVGYPPCERRHEAQCRGEC
jgi:hypothetical protein